MYNKEERAMMEKIWKYTVNEEECGGIVVADSREEAEKKVRERYGDWHGVGSSIQPEIIVWKAVEDACYCADHPDVLEVY